MNFKYQLGQTSIEFHLTEFYYEHSKNEIRTE